MNVQKINMAIELDLSLKRLIHQNHLTLSSTYEDNTEKKPKRNYKNPSAGTSGLEQSTRANTDGRSCANSSCAELNPFRHKQNRRQMT